MQIKGDLNVVFLLEMIRDRYGGLLNSFQTVFLLAAIDSRRQTSGPGLPSLTEQAELLRSLEQVLSRDSVNMLSHLLDALNGEPIERVEDREILH